MKKSLSSILARSLDHMAALEHFYNVQYSDIEKMARKGMEDHFVGWSLNLFFTFYVFGSEEDKKSEGFKSLERAVRKLVSFKVDSSTSEEERGVRFKFRNTKMQSEIGCKLDVQRSFAEYLKFQEMPRLHGNSALIMLIIKFEEFIAEVLALLCRKFPRKYLEEENVKYSELTGGNIVAVRENLIQRKVDAYMRESYMNWFKIFESHGMDASAWDEPLQRLAEIYARRNIIVHNSGVVNATYLSNVQGSKEELGTCLTASKQYVDEAFGVIREMMVLIMLEASRVVPVGDVNDYLYSIFEHAFEFLKDGKYQLSEIAFFWLSRAKNFSEKNRTMSLFNFWMAKLWGGTSDDLLLNEIKSFDVTAKEVDFKIAKYILLEQYDEATELIEDSLMADESLPANMLQWPLFLKYRKSKHFKKLLRKYADKFGRCKWKQNKNAENVPQMKDIGFNNRSERMTRRRA